MTCRRSNPSAAALAIVLLLVFSLVRGALRRKPKRSSEGKKRRGAKRAPSRRSPPEASRSKRPLADDLIKEWSEAYVAAHKNASKDAANKAAATLVIRFIASYLRPRLREPAWATWAADAIEQLDRLRERQSKGRQRLDGQAFAAVV